MNVFTPYNWYSVGLKSPVEYYLAAAQFSHTIDTIVISRCTQEDNRYSIFGKCMPNNNLVNFETHITAPYIDKDSRNHESDFVIQCEGVLYRIETTIDVNKQYMTNTKTFDNPIPNIQLDLPLYIKKLAMLVLHLEI